MHEPIGDETIYLRIAQFEKGLIQLTDATNAYRTPGEFKKLFAGDWSKVWNNDRISCTANKLAALTGMRASEVLGLKGGFVYDNHIYLCKQFDEYGYRDTKKRQTQHPPAGRLDQ